MSNPSFYQCCGSGMFIPDPGSWFLPIPDPGSRIPDPGSRIQKQQQKTGVKNFFLSNHTVFCSHKFHKTEYYFTFDMLKENIWPNFPRIFEVFTQKIVTKHSKIWVRDLGSGKNLFRIPDPGSRGQKGTGSRIRIRNTGFYNKKFHFEFFCLRWSLKNTYFSLLRCRIQSFYNIFYKCAGIDS